MWEGKYGKVRTSGPDRPPVDRGGKGISSHTVDMEGVSVSVKAEEVDNFFSCNVVSPSRNLSSETLKQNYSFSLVHRTCVTLDRVRPYGSPDLWGEGVPTTPTPPPWTFVGHSTLFSSTEPPFVTDLG